MKNKDELFTQAETLTKEKGELQQQVLALENAINTLNGKVRLLNEAMAKDAVEDVDATSELMKVNSKLFDLQKETDAIAYAVGVAPYDFKSVLGAIEGLRINTEEAIKPVLQERNELYQIIFDQGQALIKRVKSSNGFWSKLWGS